jgi:hypothetical protein
MTNDQITANLCLLTVCCGWPGLCAFLAFNVGRHGLRGWLHSLVIRAKQFGPPEEAL